MIDVKYNHNLANFSSMGMIASLGLPLLGNVLTQQVVVQITVLIEAQVNITALKLNTMLKNELMSDMMSIPEYARFPAYISTMINALSSPTHVGIYWDKAGLIQAKFVDMRAIGGIEELIEIQYAVYPERGTLEGWRGLYIAWQKGTSNVYSDVIGRRLELMNAQQMAPFLELVEKGNDRYGAYPINFGTGTFKRFKSIYKKEMLNCYLRILMLMRMLIISPLSIAIHKPAIATVDGQVFHGHEWVSRSGNTIFVISGTERLSGKVFTGKGFIFNKQGFFLRSFFGRIPKI